MHSLEMPVRPGGRSIDGLAAGWTGPALVVVSTCFNLVLCFINTKHWMHIGTLQISIIQVGLLAIGALAIRDRVGLGLMTGALLLGLFSFSLKLINPAIDQKILFDLALIPTFILLGQASTTRQADQVVGFLLIGVIAIGLIELLLPTMFEGFFNIHDYYVNKGAVDPDDINASQTAYFASGTRSDYAGRNMLAEQLGPHRVSSVFLEPVSMGNFPVICLIWLFGRSRLQERRTVMALCGVAACVVLPDSRFAALCCLLMLGMRLVPASRSAVVAAGLPIATLAAVYLLGFTQALSIRIGPEMISDDLGGRLRFSGALLRSWSIGEWLAIIPSPVYTADTGYAYVVNAIGLPAAGILWALLVGWMARSEAQRDLMGYVSLYVAASLCVGASLFSIKTGALLWFLLGAADQTRLGDQQEAARAIAVGREPIRLS